MQLRLLLGFLGILLIFLSLFMLFPLFFAFYYKEDITPLSTSFLITLVVGLLLFLFFRSPKRELRIRDGFALVTLGWITSAFFGALPFYLGHFFPSFVDSYFEAMSGFTTTGASVLTEIEHLPKGILFWRSLTHWLGGMGIIVFSLALLPLLGVGGMQLFKAESPGPVADKIKPRIAETAKTLWKIYILISGVEAFLLMLGGMNLFEALCHTFGTMATGGFSTKNTSIGSYNSAFIDWVIIIFMVVAGANFSLHYRFLTGKFKSYFNNTEFKFYIAVIVVSIVIFTIILRLHIYDNIFSALRHGAFQVCSIMTTTGYTTANFEKWPYFTQFFLVILMFIGGSAGSTGGGIKCIRIYILLKHGYRELLKLVHPKAVISLKMGKKAIPYDILQSIWGFFFLFMFIFVLASLAMTLLGLDIITSFVSVAATINNIGPGLGTVGPAENYAHIPVIGKWILIFCMLVGRLELYTVIVMFIPEFWKK
ncbi:MAG: TrkH family potassium uptake protein [Deltaproteobacteria bacterium]|nr:TrkH family potassium uptake protein [Deltaproteobacteria bacterium]